MKDDWAEKLKQKLEGHQKTPPAGLWEDISKEMGFEAKPVQQKPAPIRRWYWTAAAAAVLALVGFFVFQKNNNEQPLQAEATSQKPISPKQEISSHVDDEPSIQTPVLALVQTSKPIHAKKKEESIKQEESEPRISEMIELQNEEKVPENEATAPPSENELANSSEPQLNKEKSLQDLPDGWTTDDSPRESSAKWSLGINASGGLLASNNSQRMGRLYYDSFANEEAFNTISLSFDKNLPYTMAEYVSEHHLPIRLGLSLNYQLSPRLALLSGISYTYLYSEFKIPLYSNASYDQKLHYLGIPLGLSYQLWASNSFQIYLSGGLMLEKCLNEKPWQWSVEAAAGIEYSLVRQLGLYLEPSLGYYFKDGTSFDHYYKEHPLAPSIEFGLRLHISK